MVRRLIHTFSGAGGMVLVVVATAAYFFRWDTVPAGYYTDAASNVLNALCLRHTGADEYGRFLPTSIRAFDDYRPPLLIYLFSVTSLFHTLTVQSARFMSMALGWGSLLLFFTVLRHRLPLPAIRWKLFFPALFGLVLTSSWILVPHRMPVEFATTLPVTLFLLLASWRWIQEPDSHRASVTAAVATGLMLYAYYGTKPLAFTHIPLLFAVLFYQHRRVPRSILSFLVVWSVFATPALLDFLGEQSGLARFGIVGSASPFDSIRAFFQHLGIDFLFLTGDGNRRHHTGFGGMLNVALLPLLLLGGVALLREVFLRKNTFWIFVSLFLVSALVPVSLTREGLPHALRTLPVLLPLVLLIILGFSAAEQVMKDLGRGRAAALAIWLVLGGWNAYLILDHYHRVTVVYDPWVWSYHPDQYRLPESLISPQIHSAETINERYERVALEGDLVYCCGDDLAQTLREAIEGAPSSERDMPGTRAFHHRKFYAAALASSGQYAQALTEIRAVYDRQSSPRPDSNDVTMYETWSKIAFTFAGEAAARGETERARQLYQESLAAARRVTDWRQIPRHFRMLAMVQRRLGLHYEAIVNLSRSFPEGQDPVAGLLGVGNSYMQEGTTEPGVFAYQTALGASVGMTAAKYSRIGGPLLSTGGLGEAIQHLRTVNAQHPSPAALFTLGLAYLYAGQIDSAHSAYRQGVDAFGEHSGIDTGAPDHLRWLIRSGIHPEAAREILMQHWAAE